MGTRLTIDSLTCLLANEHDPSRLLASSPGKLVRYLVANGEHLGNDQPYAEVEASHEFIRDALLPRSAPQHSVCTPVPLSEHG